MSDSGLAAMTRLYVSFVKCMDKDDLSYDDFKRFNTENGTTKLLKTTKLQPKNKGYYTFLLYTQLFSTDTKYIETVIDELRKADAYDFISCLPDEAFKRCLKIQIKYNLK